MLPLIGPTVCVAQADDMRESSCKRLRGVWSIESMDVGLGPEKRTRVPKAFMLFLGETHYAAIRDLSELPEENTGESSTADRAFMADAGTYEFDGTDLVVHHRVAGFPVLGSMTFGCSMQGDDTLILTPQYDKMVLPGLDLKPTEDGKLGYGDIATRYVFRRLE